MFEPEKKRYLTRGVDETIPSEMQLFMWQAIDHMPEPKDYLQVFTLSVENGPIEKLIIGKIYCIDSEDYCTMLLAEEY